MRSMYSYRQAFALPTVLVASIVMMIMLVAAISAVSSVNTVLKDEYINSLARSAADAGIEFMSSCMNADMMPVVPTDVSATDDFTPDSTTCKDKKTNVAITSYLVNTPNIKTYFKVKAPTFVDGVYSITATGYVELTRTTGGGTASARTVPYTKTLRANPGFFKPQQLIVYGYENFLATMPNGELWTWGKNDSGQLGLGDTTTRVTPVKLMNGPVKIAKTDQCSSTSYAIMQNNDLYTWGFNGWGQVGDGTTTNRLTPYKVLSDVKSVNCGSYNMYAVTNSGDVYSWGGNRYGGVGDGTKTTRTTPYKVITGTPTSKAVKTVIDKGSADFAVALMSDGKIYTWGNNYYGQIGNGDIRTEVLSPYLVGGVVGGKNIIDVTIADAEVQVTALASDGSVYYWSGQVYEPQPVLSTALSGVIKIQGSEYGTFLTDNTGRVWGWGRAVNPYSLSSPKVLFSSGVKDIQVGEGLKGVLKTDGSLWIWGGVGDCSYGSSVPAVATISSGVKEMYIDSGERPYISFARDTAYALMTDGRLVFWGKDTATLGTTSQCTPTTILTEVAYMGRTQGREGYAIRTDNSLWSWGSPYYPYRVGRNGTLTVPGKVSLPAIPPVTF